MRIVVNDTVYDLPSIGTPVYFVKEYGNTYRLLRSCIHHVEIHGYSLRLMYERTLGKGDFGEVQFRDNFGSGYLSFDEAKTLWEQFTGKKFVGGQEKVVHC